MLSKRRILGLAVEGRSLTAVELVQSNGGAEAVRAAEFAFPEGLGLFEPAKLGKALRQFLKDNRFSASRCVLGMEARWLTARDKALPPGSAGAVRQILSLAVEREFASDLKDLVFDYAPADAQANPAPTAAGAQSAPAGNAAPQDATTALLVAAPRPTVEQLAAMAQAAGLRVLGITSSTMALGDLAAKAGLDEVLVLRVFGGGAELLTRSGGAARMVRPLPVATPPNPAPNNGWMDRLTEELRRVLMLLPGLPAGRPARQLQVWNEAGLTEPIRDLLASRLQLNVQMENLPKGIHVAALGAGARPGQFCAAAAIALAAIRHQPLPVDFLHSRLARVEKSSIQRKVVWAAGLAAAVIAAGAIVAWDWQQDRNEIAELQAKTRQLAPSIAEARRVIDRTTLARTWYDHRPAYMACLRELTLAFPAEGRIWTTRVSVQEDRQVVFSGKAVSEGAVLDVLDRLKANPRLSQVKPLYLRESGKDRQEVAFAMSFIFTKTD